MDNSSKHQSYSWIESSVKNYLILFILWPFLAFILALKNYSQKNSRKVVYFFLIYYGLTFVNNNQYVDAYRYALNLKATALVPFSDFGKVIKGLYSDTTVDIVEPFISFVVSRFTSYSGIYFAVWAAIFGFFYLKSINQLYNRYQENRSLNALVPMLFFVSIAPITLISSVRMWTAAWIFLYGAYHVVIYRDRRYLLLALAASLLHWSFLSANFILLIYTFAGNRNYIYLPLAVVSFIVPTIVAPYLQSVSTSMGGAIQNRYEGYSSEGFMLSQQESLEQASWFLKIGNNLVFYYLLFAILIIRIRTKMEDSENEGPERNLYSFVLLFLTFINFGSTIPSFGSRFKVLFFLLATMYIFLYTVRRPATKINWFTVLGLFPMVLYTAINFRTGSESISVWLFSPVLGSPFVTSATSLAEILFY